MGSGKTTIGRQLAMALHREFRDSDHEIVGRTGASIPLIFEIEGEAGFRKREREVIGDITSEPGLVLATGGGAILAEENRRVLRERGTVVYLYATIEQLLRRTAKDRNRPLLQTADPKAKL
ncbi:MAG TPA: shikimate kinase, partial [Fibrobacteria bacterium]|nr:shikimate kinase [Fibrobacteria bacterium]